MAQSVTLQSAPVELELERDLERERDPEYDHYYAFDQFDQSSATALASQHSDTLGASASDPPSGLGPPEPASAAWDPSLRTGSHDDHDHGHGHDHGHDHDHGYEDSDEGEGDYQRQQSQQPPVSPPSWPADSQLPPTHKAHQGQGQQQPSQPYHPESGPVHASASSPPHSASLNNNLPRSTRSYSVAASLASVGSQSSIRRKPLSPTASPLAVRFSSRLNGTHSPLHDLHHPDSGYYSLDSPDLYDQSSNKQEPAPVPTLAPGPSLPTPLEEESDEDGYVTFLFVVLLRAVLGLQRSHNMCNKHC